MAVDKISICLTIGHELLAAYVLLTRVPFLVQILRKPS